MKHTSTCWKMSRVVKTIASDIESAMCSDSLSTYKENDLLSFCRTFYTRNTVLNLPLCAAMPTAPRGTLPGLYVRTVTHKQSGKHLGVKQLIYNSLCVLRFKPLSFDSALVTFTDRNILQLEIRTGDCVQLHWLNFWPEPLEMFRKESWISPESEVSPASHPERPSPASQWGAVTETVT